MAMIKILCVLIVGKLEARTLVYIERAHARYDYCYYRCDTTQRGLGPFSYGFSIEQRHFQMVERSFR